MKETVIENPFVLQPYVSKDLFCDRETELHDIISYIESGANISLISMRRLGKTGLIWRTFEDLADKEHGYVTIYVDIFATTSIEDFISALAAAVVAQIKESGIRKFFSKLGGIRPLLSYDPVSGQPQVSITYQTENEKFTTLDSIFDYLEGLGNKVVVAIDEFQQIREYEGVYMEALLRSKIQNLKNVRFIFSGSDKRLMSDIFVGERSPFYQSVINVPLSKLDKAVYSEFIIRLFGKGGKQITEGIVNYILEWSRCHTFYTQVLCNFTYMVSGNKASMEDVYAAIDRIFKSETDKFFTIRAMLTKGQWKYLTCVAKEGVLRQPTSGDFLNKYKIGTPASSKRYLSSLLDKNLLYEEKSLSGSEYCVYNVFLSRWLERL